MPSDTNPDPGRRTLAVAVTLVVVASAAVAGVSLTAVGIASAQSTGIESCTTIDEPGVYELTANVTTVDDCIEIVADDVTFDGNGHTINVGITNDFPNGIVAGPTVSGVENVTVRDVTVHEEGDGSTGVAYRHVTDGVVANVTLSSRAGFGTRLVVTGGENVTFRDSVVRDGVIRVSADDSAVVDNRIGETTFGSEVMGNRTVVRNNTVAGAGGFMAGNADTLAVEGRDVVVEDNVVTGGYVDRLVVGGTNATVRDNRVVGVGETSDYYTSLSGIVVSGENNTVVGNDASRNRDAGIALSGAGHVVRDNVATGNGVGVRVTSRDSLIYDNVLEANTTLAGVGFFEDPRTDAATVEFLDPDRPTSALGYRPNTWNVSPRPGANVLGGTTVGGNYYALTDGTGFSGGTGFSEACADDDGDDVCDHPNVIAPNNTDSLPLAAPGDASVAYFEVSDISPSRFTMGEETTVNATVTNVGTEPGTQTVTFRANTESTTEGPTETQVVTRGRTVTLAPGETATVPFDVTFEYSELSGLLTVESANSSLSVDGTIVEPTDPGDGDEENVTNYQVDFAAGQPIENLSADTLYAGQDRLFRFAFGNTDEGITQRGSAWAAETLRECVDYGHVVSTDDGDTAQVTFTVNESCGGATLTLAVYSLPGETFEFETADQQELLAATTGTYGPGTHTITVDLPDGDD